MKVYEDVWFKSDVTLRPHFLLRMHCHAARQSGEAHLHVQGKDLFFTLHRHPATPPTEHSTEVEEDERACERVWSASKGNPTVPTPTGPTPTPSGTQQQESRIADIAVPVPVVPLLRI